MVNSLRLKQHWDQGLITSPSSTSSMVSMVEYTHCSVIHELTVSSCSRVPWPLQWPRWAWAHRRVLPASCSWSGRALGKQWRRRSCCRTWRCWEILDSHNRRAARTRHWIGSSSLQCFPWCQVYILTVTSSVQKLYRHGLQSTIPMRGDKSSSESHSDQVRAMAVCQVLPSIAYI